MWLLIDDLRNLNVDVIARTPRAGKAMLAFGGWKCLCLDHDLGADESGYDILVWGLKYKFIPDKVQLVTSNPVGRERMRNALISADFYTKDGINFKRKIIEKFYPEHYQTDA